MAQKIHGRVLSRGVNTIINVSGKYFCINCKNDLESWKREASPCGGCRNKSTRPWWLNRRANQSWKWKKDRATHGGRRASGTKPSPGEHRRCRAELTGNRRESLAMGLEGGRRGDLQGSRGLLKLEAAGPGFWVTQAILCGGPGL